MANGNGAKAKTWLYIILSLIALLTSVGGAYGVIFTVQADAQTAIKNSGSNTLAMVTVKEDVSAIQTNDVIQDLKLKAFLDLAMSGVESNKKLTEAANDLKVEITSLRGDIKVLNTEVNNLKERNK